MDNTTAPSPSISGLPATDAPASQPARPVVATVPAALFEASGDIDVCVRHTDWGEVEVDVRPAGRGTWTPLHLVGGKVEVRSQ